MTDDLTNIGNPQNRCDDLEERNQPHVTPIPAEAQADDLFDDAAADEKTRDRQIRESRERDRRNP